MSESSLLQTPSQTVGPYFAYGLTSDQYGYPFPSLNDGMMIDDSMEGERITVRGRVFDGLGETIPDAMIELWQADAHGQYLQTGLGPQRLFGRQGTGTPDNHEFVFHTIKPGSSGGQAPVIHVLVFMRGQLSHSYTRIYFAEEVAHNSRDEVLLSVPPERRFTLLVSRSIMHGMPVYHFDIHMQGEKETVFFDV